MSEHFDTERVSDLDVGVGTVANQHESEPARQPERRGCSASEPGAERVEIGEPRSRDEKRKFRRGEERRAGALGRRFQPTTVNKHVGIEVREFGEHPLQHRQCVAGLFARRGRGEDRGAAGERVAVFEHEREVI